MSNIVDFNKAKEAADKKKADQEKRKLKNQRLAEKRRRFDAGKKLKTYHYFLIIFVFSVLFVLIRSMT